MSICSLRCVSLALVALSLVACTRSDDDPLFREIVESRELTVGGGGPDQVVRLASGAHVVEVIVPGAVAPTPTRAYVSLVTGVTRKGQAPVNDFGVLVDPAGLTFAQPVRVRQRVAAPPPRKTYAAVVVPDQGTAFVVRSFARPVGPADPASGEEGELWEGDGEGSGLWGLALVDAPSTDANPDAGGTDAGSASDDAAAGR